MFYLKFIFWLFFVYIIENTPYLSVEYTAYIRQTLNEERRKEFGNDEFGRLQIKANEEPPNETYQLYISNEESSFMYEDRISNSQNQKFDIRFAPGGFGMTYCNLKDSIQLKEIGEIYGKHYIIKEFLYPYDWEILNESKKILDFEVKKAITTDQYGNSVIAWYAPDIPYSNGPSVYWGLPGLILEIERSSNTMDFKAFFKANSLVFLKKNPKIKKPSKGIEIQESDLEGIYEQGRKKQLEYSNQGIEREH